MNTATSSVAEGRVILHHRRHAKQQRGKAIGHLGPAVVLFLGILPVLKGDETLTPLLALEVAVGVAYLALMVRELLHLRRHPFHHEAVAWLELAAAAILFIEGYHIWHRHHETEAAGAAHRLHILPGLYTAVGVVYVVLAFRARQLAERRYLHLHPEGFAVRTKGLGPVHNLRWTNIAAVEPDGPADMLVHCPDGQSHRISFASLHDGPAHRDRLLAHCQTAMKSEEVAVSNE